jgi:hypothetical protein
VKLLDDVHMGFTTVVRQGYSPAASDSSIEEDQQSMIPSQFNKKNAIADVRTISRRMRAKRSKDLQELKKQNTQKQLDARTLVSAVSSLTQNQDLALGPDSLMQQLVNTIKTTFFNADITN